MTQQYLFKWRHFQAEIILLCVRWYLRYALSYRDLEELMEERGLNIDHTTIFRWVQVYAPELEKRCRPHLKACTDSWKVDETYLKGVTPFFREKPTLRPLKCLLMDVFCHLKCKRCVQQAFSSSTLSSCPLIERPEKPFYLLA